jgi:hypothetical protein
MPLPEEDKHNPDELTKRVDALETALVALMQAQDDETKRRLTGIAQQLLAKFSARKSRMPAVDLLCNEFEEAFSRFLDLISRAIGRDWLRH